uniref:TM2 domain-containing protein n=1 Tax=Caenorhabditis japonica TaxID=281687 RepID=A0A8R1HMF2_CAEJA
MSSERRDQKHVEPWVVRLVFFFFLINGERKEALPILTNLHGPRRAGDVGRKNGRRMEASDRRAETRGDGMEQAEESEDCRDAGATMSFETALRRRGRSVSTGARCLIIIGGIFGVHRLYLRQIPEAFVFFSTLGVFLIGWLYDSFMFRYEVEEYNNSLLNCDENGREREKEKYKKGKLLAAQSKLVDFSFTRFLYSVLYGSYIGFATWLACTVTFGWTDINSIPFIGLVAMGVTAGIYIIGQCGGQSRELAYIWLAAFSSFFIMIRLAQMTVFRATFLSAIVSTVIGNRSAKVRKRRHTWKHFLFWSSLYLMLICVILLGCSRKVADKQVTATRPGTFSQTISVGSLLRDRIFEPKKVYSFFAGNPLIEYHSKADRKSTKNSPKKGGKLAEKSSIWQRIWSGEMFDELTGAAHLTKIDWIELTTTFIVDVLRAESRVVDKSSTVEPFKWALWRNYLIHNFSLDPLVADDRLHVECKRWQTTEKAARKNEAGKEQDFGVLATRQACSTFMS